MRHEFHSVKNKYIHGGRSRAEEASRTFRILSPQRRIEFIDVTSIFLKLVISRRLQILNVGSGRSANLLDSNEKRETATHRREPDYRTQNRDSSSCPAVPTSHHARQRDDAPSTAEKRPGLAQVIKQLSSGASWTQRRCACDHETAANTRRVSKTGVPTTKRAIPSVQLQRTEGAAAAPEPNRG